MAWEFAPEPLAGARHVRRRRILCDLREQHCGRPGGSSPTQPEQMKPIRPLYESGKAETIEILSHKLGGGRGRSARRFHHTRPAMVNMTDVRDLCVYVGFFFFSLLLRLPPWSQIRKTLGPPRGFKSSAGIHRLHFCRR